MSQVGTIDLTMASESNKKRKRSGESAAKPKKKVAIDAPPSSATVSSVLRPKFCPPVIATIPGFELPKNTPFHSYAPKNGAKSKNEAAQVCRREGVSAALDGASQSRLHGQGGGF
ncbi:DNA-directed RNA polymerase I subunit rpa49 [Fusarium solani]